MEMKTILKKLMDHADETPYTLQVRTGFPQPTTTRFLQGAHGNPQARTVAAWAAAYQVTEAQLRGFEPLPDPLPPVPKVTVSARKKREPPLRVHSELRSITNDLADIRDMSPREARVLFEEIRMRAAQLRLARARAEFDAGPHSS